MSWGSPVYIGGQLVGYSAESLQVRFMAEATPWDADELAKAAAGAAEGFERLKSLSIPCKFARVSVDVLRKAGLLASEPWTPPGERKPNRAERRRRR